MLKTKRVCFTILLLAALTSPSAEAERASFADIRDGLALAVADLGLVIDRLETLQQVMERSAKANRSYDEQKNIFLSSMLANTTIAAVCQYEADHLTLFIDLREKNRRKYYAIRIESLQTSIRQIRNMNRQIQINYSIFPADFFERSVAVREQETIDLALEVLQKSIGLLQSALPPPSSTSSRRSP